MTSSRTFNGTKNAETLFSKRPFPDISPTDAEYVINIPVTDQMFSIIKSVRDINPLCLDNYLYDELDYLFRSWCSPRLLKNKYTNIPSAFDSKGKIYRFIVKFVFTAFPSLEQHSIAKYMTYDYFIEVLSQCPTIYDERPSEMPEYQHVIYPKEWGYKNVVIAMYNPIISINAIDVIDEFIGTHRYELGVEEGDHLIDLLKKNKVLIWEDGPFVINFKVWQGK